MRRRSGLSSSRPAFCCRRLSLADSLFVSSLTFLILTSELIDIVRVRVAIEGEEDARGELERRLQQSTDEWSGVSGADGRRGGEGSGGQWRDETRGRDCSAQTEGENGTEEGDCSCRRRGSRAKGEKGDTFDCIVKMKKPLVKSKEREFEESIDLVSWVTRLSIQQAPQFNPTT